jgi:hypothetical protein
VVAAAVIETLAAEETGDGKEEDAPPPHAATSKLKTTTLARPALKAAGLRSTGDTFGLLRKIILKLLHAG